MEKIKKSRFGFKQAGALVLSIGILWLAWVFHGQIESLAGFGYLGAFLAMFVSSATIVLPAPGVVMVFAIASAGFNPILIGLVSGIGAALGELVGYFAGYSGSEALDDTKKYQKIKTKLEKNPRTALWTIGVLAFIPNPLFDLAGLASGALRLPLRDFLIATIVGKSLRMLLIAFAGFYSLDWLSAITR